MKFKARIYKVGINTCVDVPSRITSRMESVKGFIKIKGQINGFEFTKTLMPVKGGDYRLFVNMPMLKGGNTALDKIAEFDIQQDFKKNVKHYPMPGMLKKALKSSRLENDFENLTPSRKKDILKYLGSIKTKETMEKNVGKLIHQLKEGKKSVRIP